MRRSPMTLTFSSSTDGSLRGAGSSDRSSCIGSVTLPAASGHDRSRSFGRVQHALPGTRLARVLRQRRSRAEAGFDGNGWLQRILRQIEMQGFDTVFGRRPEVERDALEHGSASAARPTRPRPSPDRAQIASPGAACRRPLATGDRSRRSPDPGRIPGPRRWATGAHVRARRRWHWPSASAAPQALAAAGGCDAPGAARRRAPTTCPPDAHAGRPAAMASTHSPRSRSASAVKSPRSPSRRELSARRVLYSCSQDQAASPKSFKPDHARTALERVERAPDRRQVAQVVGPFAQARQRLARALHHLARLVDEDLAHLRVVFQAGAAMHFGLAARARHAPAAARLAARDARARPVRPPPAPARRAPPGAARRRWRAPAPRLRRRHGLGQRTLVGQQRLLRQPLSPCCSASSGTSGLRRGQRQRLGLVHQRRGALGSSSSKPPKADRRCVRRPITAVRLPSPDRSGTATSPSAAAR